MKLVDHNPVEEPESGKPLHLEPYRDPNEPVLNFSADRFIWIFEAEFPGTPYNG